MLGDAEHCRNKFELDRLSSKIRLVKLVLNSGQEVGSKNHRIFMMELSAQNGFKLYYIMQGIAGTSLSLIGCRQKFDL